MMPALPLTTPGLWSWSIKAELLEHVRSFADHTICGIDDDGLARFTQVRAIRRAEVTRLEFVGQVRVATADGEIDATLADPWIELDPTAGAIGIRRHDGGIAPLIIARFALPQRELLNESFARWSDAVPVLSLQGSELLAGRYSPRTRLDQMTFTASLPK